jgi:CheY-like chemotaxis protein
VKKPVASRKQCLVLLVGDSPEGYELHSEILARAGYAVAGAESGDEAYRMALETAPDLIVLDLREGRDINAATRKLKSDSRTSRIPMLMLTAHVTTKLYETAKAGDTAAIVKPPVAYENLLAEVQRHVGPREGGGSVLVIEDEEDIRNTIADILDNDGIRTVTASDGREAIEWLRKARVKPRVILLDLMMPVMDGWTFRAEQLADPDLAAIPVVILSAATDLGRWARELAVADVLAKPIDLPRLLSAIERHV